MSFKIKGSHIVALAIAAGIGGWMYTGEIVIGGQSDGNHALPIAEREAKRSSELFKVRYVSVQPELRTEEIIVRGRTQAQAVVSVRPQVSGVLLERLVSRGDKVTKGQIVCKIDAGARKAQLSRAQAQLAKARVDFESNSKLVAKGIVSKNRLKTMQASLDSAAAEIRQAMLNLERSDVRATASGTVQDPIAEIGDMLSVGGICVTLVQSDPMKFSGQISERDIDKVTIGNKSIVKLIGGREIEGNVRYISPSADAKTRTFLTEIELPNPDGQIRDGITARAHVVLPAIEAYRLSPAWITLSEDGKIGVRVVNKDQIVKFVEVKLIAQTNSGFWVLGLSPGARVISLGQEYVIENEKVEASADVLHTAGYIGGVKK